MMRSGVPLAAKAGAQQPRLLCARPPFVQNHRLHKECPVRATLCAKPAPTRVGGKPRSGAGLP